jgi:hypothetical protein
MPVIWPSASVVPVGWVIVTLSAVIVLNASIRASLDAHNADAKPFRWTAPADTIIGKHHRRKRPLESLP